MDLVVFNDHKGLVNAVQTHFQGTSWQWCQTHYIRYLLDACLKAVKGEFHSA